MSLFPRRSSPALLLLVSWPLAGCPVLSDADLQSRLDVDGDGAIDRELGGDDCNDRDPTIKPGAPERCDGEDNNCDGLENEGDPRLENADWWLDADQDGHGRADTHLRTCADIGTGHDNVWVANGDDCDDTDAEQVPGQRWDLDGDGDGFATRVESRRLTQCARPRGYVVALDAGDEEDCDDNDPRVAPDAPEVCNDRDDNCDGQVDDDDPELTDGTATYPDEDGDGWGDDAQERQSCFEQIPVGYLRRGGDCDDQDPSINPEAEEVWYDGIDTDCKLDHDQDQDGDGFRADVDDCDDLHDWTYPDAPDICDGIDNGCTDDTWSQEDEDTGVYFVPRNGATPLSFTYQLSHGGEARLVDSGVLRFCGDGPTPGADWTGSVQLVSSGLAVDVVGARGRPVLDAGHATPFALSIDTLLTNARVENLVLTGGGQACLSVNAGTIDLTDLEVTNCGTLQYGDPFVGGGLDLRAGTAITLTRVSVHDNQASSLGGGGRLESEAVTLDDCDVFANHASTGAGLYVSGGSGKVTVLNSRIHGNVASGTGGGLYVQSGDLDLSSSSVYENEALGDGAGLMTFGGGTVEASEVYANVGPSGWRAEGEGDLTLTTGSKVRDHLGTAFVVDGAAVTCSGGARFRDNAVGVFVRTGSLEGDQCDMSSGAQDNDVDVETGPTHAEYPYDGPSTFSCNRTGCTP